MHFSHVTGSKLSTGTGMIRKYMRTCCVHACRLQRLQYGEAVRRAPCTFFSSFFLFWPVEQGYIEDSIHGDLATQPQFSRILPSIQAKSLVDASFSTGPFLTLRSHYEVKLQSSRNACNTGHDMKQSIVRIAKTS